MRGANDNSGISHVDNTHACSDWLTLLHLGVSVTPLARRLSIKLLPASRFAFVIKCEEMLTVGVDKVGKFQ